MNLKLMIGNEDNFINFFVNHHGEVTDFYQLKLEDFWDKLPAVDFLV